MFWLDLSLAYGRPVKELQETITPKEFMELMAYERIRGPIGGDRLDHLMVFLCSVFGAAHGGGEIQWPEWWGVKGAAAKKKLTVEQAGKSMMAMGMAKVVKQ